MPDLYDCSILFRIVVCNGGATFLSFQDSRTYDEFQFLQSFWHSSNAEFNNFWPNFPFSNWRINSNTHTNKSKCHFVVVVVVGQMWKKLAWFLFWSQKRSNIQNISCIKPTILFQFQLNCINFKKTAMNKKKNGSDIATITIASNKFYIIRIHNSM